MKKDSIQPTPQPASPPTFPSPSPPASPFPSHFASVKKLPEDPILGLSLAFAADPRPHKVNLGVGAYRDAEGKPVVFSSVRKAEKLLLEKNLNKEYLPIQGNSEYLKASTELIFGKSLAQNLAEQTFSIQTIGGTGALRLGGEFLAQAKERCIYIPDPTWLNHHRIFNYAGMNIKTYPYYNAAHRSLDFAGICASIQQMPAGSVILLHSSCHNPTGIDPNTEQWHELSQLIKKQNLIPFFDLAYPGLGRDLDADMSAMRYFTEQEHELFIATSYSKIFGLYGERIGMLTVISPHQAISQSIGSHLKVLARGSYSNPQLHGERIIATILQSETLRQEWQEELTEIRQRIHSMRQQLATNLAKALPQLSQALNLQQGMFAFTGIEQHQLDCLCKDYAIYMADSGRINLAGLNARNFEYVVQSLITVLTS
jgi:aspartate/tyrosine/aromatic aminotransferase